MPFLPSEYQHNASLGLAVSHHKKSDCQCIAERQLNRFSPATSPVVGQRRLMRSFVSVQKAENSASEVGSMGNVIPPYSIGLLHHIQHV